MPDHPTTACFVIPTRDRHDDLIAEGMARDVVRGRLAVLPVEGTPLDLLWHATSLGASRRSPLVGKLERFLETPDAMHAIHHADGSVPVSRFKPPVYVTLWS